MSSPELDRQSGGPSELRGMTNSLRGWRGFRSLPSTRSACTEGSAAIPVSCQPALRDPPQASFFLSAGATVNRANSYQSASSGFLEEPPEPPALQVEGPVRVGVGTGGSSLQCTAMIGKGSRGLEDTRHRHPRDRGQRSDTGPGAGMLSIPFPSVSFGFTKQRS